MLDAVSPSNLTTPPTPTDTIDIDTAIRYGTYPTPSHTTPPTLVTDWKGLNKIYKLQIPSALLSDPNAKTAKGERWHKEYEEIISTSVAMKLVAA